MAQSVVVDYGHSEPVIALDKDSFPSSQASQFIVFCMEIDESCTQVTKKLVREMNPKIQFFPTSFESLYHNFSIIW